MNHVRGLIIISYFFSILTKFRLIATKSPLNREFALCLERGSLENRRSGSTTENCKCSYGANYQKQTCPDKRSRLYV